MALEWHSPVATSMLGLQVTCVLFFFNWFPLVGSFLSSVKCWVSWLFSSLCVDALPMHIWWFTIFFLLSPLSGFTAWHWTTQRNTSTWLGSLRVETPSTDGVVWTVGKLGEQFGHKGLYKQKGRLKTGFAWLCCMQESQIKNCSCWDPWKKRKHKIWNRLKFLLECNIQKRELGRQMSHLTMLSRTFKRSLLGIPVLPCVLDGL